MFTKMGPSFTCLFVGYVEEKMLLTYTGTKPIMLRRYIDDNIGISTSTKSELEDFMQYVNDFHPSLSYTYRDHNTVETPGTTSCHRPRCNICSHVTLGNIIRGPLRNWNVLGSHTCISSNVITP